MIVIGIVIVMMKMIVTVIVTVTMLYLHVGILQCDLLSKLPATLSKAYFTALRMDHLALWDLGKNVSLHRRRQRRRQIYFSDEHF